MRICVIGPSKQFFSGLTVHTILLANALSKQNKTTVILFRNLLPKFLYPGRDHVGKTSSLVEFSDGTEVYGDMDWNSPVSWLKASRFIRQHRPDAIIMLWWSSTVAHMQLLLALANRLGPKGKLILEMHEIVDPLEESIWPIRLYSRIVGRLLIRQADAYTVHSSTMKNQVIEIYGIPSDKIFVKPFGLYEDYQYNSSNDQAKSDLGISEQFVILNFGKIRKYKGIPFLIKAFSALSETVADNTRLIIAGPDWGDDKELHESIESSPHKSKITFNPHFVPDEVTPKYFAAADVVVLPYLRTAGSGVANIAMAHGKPIITSDLATMRQLLENYQGSIFVKPGDVSAIRSALEELKWKCSMGETLSYMPPPASWDGIVKEYDSIIAKL